MTASAQGKYARAGGTWTIWALLAAILVVEVILDILLAPADEVLVPAEAIGDIAFIAVSLLSAFASSQGSGREIRSRRGAVGRLHRSRRAIVSGGIAVIAFWAFFVAILVFQWWFSIHHPLLTVLLGIFELGFDLLFLLVGAVLTVGFLIAPRADSGRRVGA